MNKSKRVAWGTSKLLWFYLDSANDKDWDYIIDDFTVLTEVRGIPVRKSDTLRSEDLEKVEIYVFAVSNASIAAILGKLATIGLSLGDTVHLYAELFAPSFSEDLKKKLGWKADPELLRYAIAATLNSRKAVHTTICGTWLFLEAARRAQKIKGEVAEIGCYEGGNALNCLLSNVWKGDKNYYLFDSFEGFPELTSFDPATNKAGDYAPTKHFGEITAAFAGFPAVKIIRGFVPGTFSEIPDNETFSLIFYDCDLYQPALDTYDFAWKRLAPGGLLLIHDYYAEPGGFHGVKQATDEFFMPLSVPVHAFWQTTMAVIQKK